MIAFWVSASVMIAAALAFLLPPLVGRKTAEDTSRDAFNLAIYRERRQGLESDHAAGALDAAQLAASVAELDRELLRDVGGDTATTDEAATRSPYPAIVVAVLLPLLAFGLYLKLGTPEALMADMPSATRGAAAGGAGDSGTAAQQAPGELPHSLQEMVVGLERKMEANPDDPEGWMMLGRSYAALNRLPEARRALEEADRRRPDHAMTLVALAEVLAGTQDNRLDGEPIALVERALALDPRFARALWLAGVHAFNNDDPGRAREMWQAVLALPGLSPQAIAQVRDAVAQTGSPPGSESERGSQTVGATENQAGRQSAAAATAGGASVTVSVSLSPDLATKVDGSETLFVFARAAQGPRMPLAIARLTARDLPATVILDESMAMTPQMTLATFPQVVIGARLSRSGNATPASGDLQGISAPLSPAGAPRLTLVIDQVLP